LRIKRIAMNNFRSYQNLVIEPEDGINVIYGNNGSGKTNILEAIYWVSFGKSFRTHEDFIMVNTNQNSCMVNIESNISGLDKVFEIIYSRDSRRKSVKVNNNRIRKHSDILGSLPVVLFSPENIMTIKGEPALRRRQIDDLLCQLSYGYYDLITRYGKEVSHRNYLLKGIREGKVRKENIEVWNSQIIDKGIEIINRRYEAINELNKILSEELNQGTTLIELNYESRHFNQFDRENMKSIFEKHFRENFAEEVARGSTTIGPHKDDIKINYNGMQAKLYASEGQQRISSVMLKLAEGLLLKKKSSAYPVVLLDDFSSELDDVNRGIIGKTFSSFRQIIITTTSLENLKGFSPHKTFHVEQLKS